MTFNEFCQAVFHLGADEFRDNLSNNSCSPKIYQLLWEIAEMVGDGVAVKGMNDAMACPYGGDAKSGLIIMQGRDKIIQIAGDLPERFSIGIESVKDEDEEETDEELH
jgi:hypothetical protein